MHRDRISQFLRIGWSVACGILGLMLIVLWVRSYWIGEIVARKTPTGLNTAIGSSFGMAFVSHSKLSTVPPGPFDIHDWQRIQFKPMRNKKLHFEFRATSQFIQAPYNFLVPLVAAVATMPWLTWQFSLRTLLIALTVVSVTIGVLVAMSR
jgi:hypothetical protein